MATVFLFILYFVAAVLLWVFLRFFLYPVLYTKYVLWKAERIVRKVSKKQKGESYRKLDGVADAIREIRKSIKV